MSKPELETFDIDPHTGFLPARPPLQVLPAYFDAWEAGAKALPHWLEEGQARRQLQQLPLLSTSMLSQKPELERAIMLLGFLGHAWVWEGGKAADKLPACLAVPWVEVAGRLGRLPILSHASLVLHNWRLKEASGPFRAENLSALLQFTPYPDESWFYVSTAEVEMAGGQVPALLLAMRQAATAGDEDALALHLEALATQLAAMRLSLARMRQGCRPTIFYQHIRPYLASFTAVTYEGVEPAVRSYHGGSAAQSSLLQSIDAALGIEHREKSSARYLADMQHYMPPAHARFIRFLAQGPDLAAVCSSSPRLRQARQACVQALMDFRNEHLKIVAQYILGPSGGQALGTGGTSPAQFLKQLRNDTGAQK